MTTKREMEKYQIIKAECQRQIDKLGNVCDMCGRNIIPLKTVDNSGNPTYWAGCMHGQNMGNFTTGVPKEIYELACKLVLNGERYYTNIENPKTENEKQYWFERQVRGVAGLIRQIEYLKNNKPRYTKKKFFSEAF